MATFYGSNADKRLNQSPYQKIDYHLDSGRVRQTTDTYTLLGTELNGDKIIMGRIPENALVTLVFTISRLALYTTASPLNIGWATSVNGTEVETFQGFYVAASPFVNWSVAPAGVGNLLLGAQRPGHFKTFTDETQVLLTLGANVNAASVGGKLIVFINYIVD